MKGWLESLSEKDRASLLEDLTPQYKEVPTEAVDPQHEDDGPATERLSDEVLDELKRRAQSELFPEMGKDLRGHIMRRARECLPDWQYRAFTLWVRGMNRNRIAKTLGVSRATVRAALDGQDVHARGERAGAINAFTAAIEEDEDFRKVVTEVAKTSINKERLRSDERILSWFKGIPNKPELFAPLGLLLLLDTMADSKREVKMNDLVPLVPRAVITPLLAQLRAHGFAVYVDGKVRIHRVPNEEE